MITPILLRGYAWMQTRYPEALWRGDPSRREIALTFDDGPHSRDTPKVLEVLAKHGVRATFFLIGKDVERTPHLVKQIHERGHQLGIHCYRHVPFPLEDPLTLRKQLDHTRDRIATAAGISPNELKDVRAPYGLFTAKTLSLLGGWGYRHIMWNCIPPHFLQPFKWTIQQILDSSLPGSIIVLHDGHHHGLLAARIVETIVPILQSQGFEFVTVKQMQGGKTVESAG
jgi:peptidoglycan/xylan/chitin deacetylase (PgdA/CDA1 family)